MSNRFLVTCWPLKMSLVNMTSFMVIFHKCSPTSVLEIVDMTVRYCSKASNVQCVCKKRKEIGPPRLFGLHSFLHINGTLTPSWFICMELTSAVKSMIWCPWKAGSVLLTSAGRWRKECPENLQKVMIEQRRDIPLQDVSYRNGWLNRLRVPKWQEALHTNGCIE